MCIRDRLRAVPASGPLLSDRCWFAVSWGDRNDKAMDSSVEHVLEGGNVAEAVVRVGATVRKPASDATAAVEALLDHFAEVGFSGAPRSLGRDELGRHVLEYVPCL